ncbi:GntR family transcriptional regulator [Frankia sp. CNm7]|uniref:GntR family transcriptional regulator n=1 Tax=Frankia nepalensis TaxID=1836974 RepID=A0A937UTY0_9ACTN|nr:GntR family transcriptional regulator [Frankia nepalensis]MBL7497809.1 GntR family transcriptional regulator [Frankia nepalensis]MBL7512661.1 GntR family transcriptional regulator [Frankia nepalensis]MBL7523186.1 GntR family transcriptional regulator [Frankia nepalensis]MBL7631710.1 GntR family transcriptional regulator [Frankia nepalensis]
MSTQRGTPLWLALSDRVAEELSQLRAGAPAPSEHELAARFDVNRLTARAALQELERRGQVRRRQGRGTVVARKLEYRVGPDWVPSWTRTVAAAGAEARTVTEDVVTRRARDDERVELGLGEHGRVVQLDRLRLCDGEKAGYQTSVLPAARMPGVRDALRADGSLYEVLAEHYGFAPGRAWIRVEHVTAPDWVARRLDLRGRPSIVLMRGRLDCQRSGVPLELTFAWLRADMFDVVVELGEWKRLPTPVPVRRVEAS